jgi:hypothetical protein
VGVIGQRRIGAGGAAATCKKYVALLAQADPDAPVATVLENTLSGTPVWTTADTGVFLCTLAGEFVLGKTVCFVGQWHPTRMIVAHSDTEDSSPDFIIVEQRDVSDWTAISGMLYTPIEILVYP